MDKENVLPVIGLPDLFQRVPFGIKNIASPNRKLLSFYALSERREIKISIGRCA
jgi:hypothetical protein